MNDLTAEYHLTIPAIIRRVETLAGHNEIVSRSVDRRIHRYCYGEMIRRARRLAAGLRALGVRPGDRVGTLAWNHHQHLEAYFAIPAIGAVLHTLNVRLHSDDLAYIVDDAKDRVIIVDESLLSLLGPLSSTAIVEHIIVIGARGTLPTGVIDYEALLAEANVDDFDWEAPDERQPASLCYTSGTTGRPKGVLYSHRAIVLQAMNWTAADTVGVRQRDSVLAVVPMFHINGWCLPFTAALVGAKLVLPGPYLDPQSLLELIDAERVTLSAGVPTVWLAVLHALDNQTNALDVSSLRTLVIGGSAVPKALVRGYQERHAVTVLQAWGMTETTALATVSSLPPDLEAAPMSAQYDWRAKQGVPMPFVEIRGRNESGLIPWNGETLGELEVRGPAVARRYYNGSATEDRFTQDLWFKTGDVVTIDARGCIEIKDRSKDLIRSGGEWISSVALENALMGHPAVAEAAVISVWHPKWGERPLAVVVLKPNRDVSADELRWHLAPDFAKWWLPESYEFVSEMPRTSTGKVLKSALRARYSESHPQTLDQ
jgi:fatty-acyl-CoA synthase